MFLSGLIVYYPGKWYELSDDLESFVHVLVVQILRYHEHDYSTTLRRESLHTHVVEKYISTTGADGCWTGQLTKMSDMKYGIISSVPLHEEHISSAFLALLTSLVSTALPTSGSNKNEAMSYKTPLYQGFLEGTVQRKSARFTVEEPRRDASGI